MLLERLRVAPSAVAGVIFGLTLMLLVDGIITAQSEANVAHRTTFTMLMPAIFSMVGFFMMILVSPVEVKNDVTRAKVVLFISWILCFSSAVAALVLCKLKFTGLQERRHSVLGVALVGFTSLMPLTGAILWWSKQSSLDDY
ncbi:hypothetical protein TraAM80_07311 [Trypanosoma rangeli]|uniref:Uncharacterized protein n=1 Tax=Trypanosoma rangeli TaxID=5698 RepID=A0A422N652_TRYRA|nr:uncharacterized protein TraAM80_07311 [Trypanosoma rangeli]RNF00921.1 hypothetical protein TraAM80_07311 [Trypanosoma rangeli]|eukprot:RNF00921.1 hypothetical protein TraAM80_07311 [Trypanosoma rangeli]